MSETQTATYKTSFLVHNLLKTLFLRRQNVLTLGAIGGYTAFGRTQTLLPPTLTHTAGAAYHALYRGLGASKSSALIRFCAPLSRLSHYLENQACYLRIGRSLACPEFLCRLPDLSGY